MQPRSSSLGCHKTKSCRNCTVERALHPVLFIKTFTQDPTRSVIRYVWHISCQANRAVRHLQKSACIIDVRHMYIMQCSHHRCCGQNVCASNSVQMYKLPPAASALMSSAFLLTNSIIGHIYNFNLRTASPKDTCSCKKTFAPVTHKRADRQKSFTMRPAISDEDTRGHRQIGPEATSRTPLRNSRLQEGFVRYVRILPELIDDDEEDTIRCATCIRRSESREETLETQTAASRDAFTYIALSYAWGDPNPRYQIFLDSKPHLIADNLWHFLRQAKADVEIISGSWLWIDALSIDQSNDEERRHQVGIMSSIFENAEQVLVWLGQAQDGSDMAMSALSDSALILQRREFYELGRRTTPDGWGSSHDHDNAFKSRATAVSDAVAALCQRPYWKRLWVFQELRHAEHITIMCGKRSIPWAKFSSLWSVLAEIGALQVSVIETLEGSLATRMMILRAKTVDSLLWNLLKETQNLACADRRDRVYALLSVATEGHEGIEADYGAYANHTALERLLNQVSSIPRADQREKAQLFLKTVVLQHDVDIVAGCHAVLATCALAHRVLRAKHAARRPATLEDVRLDCEFLVGVFGFEEVEEDWMRIFGDRIRPQDDWSEWARIHNHDAVARLLQQEHNN